MRQRDLLTKAEHDAVDLLGEASDAITAIIGDGGSRHDDSTELVIHIHALQNMVLAQAAARAFPRRYRRLGE